MTSTPSFLDRIGEALGAELRKQRRQRFPVGTIKVTLASWTDAGPYALELLPCPANPTASWGAEHDAAHAERAAVIPWTARLMHVNVDGSRSSDHLSGMRDEWRVDDTYYPAHDIHSDFVSWGIASGPRLWAEEDYGLRAAGLYLPLPGLAHLWPKFADVPNIDMTATYSFRGDAGEVANCEVLIASRFTEDAVRAKNYICHNTHLFDMQPPVAWSTELKQFGDERTKRVVRRKPKKKKAEPGSVAEATDPNV